MMGEFDDSDVELVDDDEDVDVDELEKAAEDAPVVKLVNLILTDAIKKGASDIHIEPYEKELPRPLPHRRRAPRGDAAAAEAARTRSPRASRSWPSSTSPSAACRRTAASSSSSAAARRWTSASRVLPDAVRREDRAASPRQAQPAARHDQARLRAAAARRLQGGDQPAVRHGAGHRPDRLGQDDDALLGALRAQQDRAPTSRTAEDPVEYNLAGINQVQMHEDIGLNFAAAPALVPAPGPGHHHGRRDPRLRDRRDRGQGRAHRPPGALDAAHQRRARRRSSACSTWASSRSSSRRRVNLRLAQRLARQHLRATARSPTPRSTPRRCSTLGIDRGADRATRTLMKGRGCSDLQRHRLQGPRRALRGDAASATSSRSSCSRRLGRRAQARGDPARHADAAHAAASTRCCEGIDDA